MPSRRRHRLAMLPEEDVRAIERDTRPLTEAIGRALTKLAPFNESYSALYRLGEQMHEALNVISGRPPDHAGPSFGGGQMPEGRAGEGGAQAEASGVDPSNGRP
jgi:hypothetical protein